MNSRQKLERIVETIVKRKLNEASNINYNDVWKKLNNNYSKFTNVVNELDTYLMSIDNMTKSGYPPKILSELVDLMIAFTIKVQYKISEGDHLK